MAEELLLTETDAPATEENAGQSESNKPKSEQSENEISLESVAREMGWRDKDEWNSKTNKPWINAREFVLREREFSDRLRDKLANTESGVKEIKNHFDRQLTAERMKHQEELKAAKKQAIIDGDVDEVDRIEREMENINTENEKGDETNPKLLDTWKKDNPWYGEDENLTEIADDIAENLQGKGKTFNEILDVINKKMKSLVPKPAKQNEPENEKNDQPTVEGKNITRKDTSKNHTIRDLTEPQREALKIFKSQIEGYTDEKYIRELEAQGVLK